MAVKRRRSQQRSPKKNPTINFKLSVRLSIRMGNRAARVLTFATPTGVGIAVIAQLGGWLH